MINIVDKAKVRSVAAEAHERITIEEIEQLTTLINDEILAAAGKGRYQVVVAIPDRLSEAIPEVVKLFSDFSPDLHDSLARPCEMRLMLSW